MFSRVGRTTFYHFTTKIINLKEAEEIKKQSSEKNDAKESIEEHYTL